MTEKWATEQSCIHIEITSCKIPSLEINSDTILADSLYYQKYPKIPHNLFGQSAQLAIIFGILKKLSLGVRSPCIPGKQILDFSHPESLKNTI